MSEQIEATVDALKAKLDAGLTGKIDDLNAESSAVQLDHPAAIIAGADEEWNYPRVFVIPDRTDRQMEGSGIIVFEHRIRLVSFVADWDTAILWRKVVRYQRAVREVILAGDREPGLGGGWTIQFIEDEYGPVFQPTTEGQPGNEFIQGGATLVRVPQQQAFD